MSYSTHLDRGTLRRLLSGDLAGDEARRLAAHLERDCDECEALLRGFVSPALFEAGLICRADDRGDPVVQISPPLVADRKLLDTIVDILGDAVEYAWGEVQKGMPTS